MRRRKKKRKKITFVIFLYACGVSRVHQEFELFEKILKRIVLILKKMLLLIPISMIRVKVTDKKCFSCSFSSLFLPTFSALFSSVVKTCWSARQLGGDTNACEKLSLRKDLGYEFRHTRFFVLFCWSFISQQREMLFKFPTDQETLGNRRGRQWTASGRSINLGICVELWGGGTGFFFFRSFEKIYSGKKKVLKWFEVVVQYLIETWKPQVSGRLTLSGLSIA